MTRFTDPRFLSLILSLLLITGPAWGQDDGEEDAETPVEEMTPQEAYRDGYREAQLEFLNRLADEPSAANCKEYGDWYATRERDFDAMQHYLMAVYKDPGHSIAHYRLAEVYALGGQEHLVMGRLTRAVEAGFWGFEALQDDEAFDDFREEEGFAQLLEQARENHAQHAPEFAGKPIIEVPEGDPPADGWPVMVFLHGWGDDHIAYWDNCADAVDNGMVGIAISGTHAYAEDSYRWDIRSDRPTHDAIQQALAGYVEEGVPIDTGRVYLTGFSQGALHGFNLLCQHPGTYAGGIILSPGGQITMALGMRENNTPRRIVVIHGEEEGAGNISLSTRAARITGEADMPVQTHTHEGGHHFPADWDERFPQWIDWLLDEAGE